MSLGSRESLDVPTFYGKFEQVLNGAIMSDISIELGVITIRKIGDRIEVTLRAKDSEQIFYIDENGTVSGRMWHNEQEFVVYPHIAEGGLSAILDEIESF